MNRRPRPVKVRLMGHPDDVADAADRIQARMPTAERSDQYANRRVDGVRVYLEIDPERDRPRLVCICASTHHPGLLEAASRRLTLDGALVLAPTPIGREPSGSEEDVLAAVHRHRIDMADEVVIVPKPDGSLGASVAEELAYAQSVGKPVTRPTPEELTR